MISGYRLPVMTDGKPKGKVGGARPGAGRPRVHPDPATRQRAYRERKKAQDRQLAAALVEMAETLPLTDDQRQVLTDAAQMIENRRI